MPVLKVKNGGTWINVSSGSGSSVQSDWNINDETSPAHIKNRPFYEEPNVWVPLLPSTEFGPFYISPMFGIPIYDRDATYDLIVGETYRITWDGVAYECVAQDISSVLPGGVGVGNGTNFGLVGNNEPFIVCILNGAEGYISLTDAEAGGSHTVSVEKFGTAIHKVDGKYLPDNVAFKEDIPEIPSQIVNTINGMTGDVTIISGVGARGEADGAEVFNSSESRASGWRSHAEGSGTYASGSSSHSEGYDTGAHGSVSHAEGFCTIAFGNTSHSEGSHTMALGKSAHAEGCSHCIQHYICGEVGSTICYTDKSTFMPEFSEVPVAYLFHNRTIRQIIDYEYITEPFEFNGHAYNLKLTLDNPLAVDGEGLFGTYADCHYNGVALGNYSHSEGYGTIAASEAQHVQGKFNIIDTEDKYAHIVGNGTTVEPSNAHTLDWDGNAWFQGDVFVGGTSQDDADRLVKLSELDGLGGASSWNDLTDKPFEPEVVYYEWDEETEYETSVDASANNSFATKLVKISDNAPDSNFFIGKTFSCEAIINGGNQKIDIPLTEKYIVSMAEGTFVVGETAIVVTVDSATIYGITLTKGIWSPSEYLETSSLKYLWWKILDPAIQLDESVIPDTIARVEDINAPKTEFILNSSTEGSTKKFKITIDDDGKLTTTEIV